MTLTSGFAERTGQNLLSHLQILGFYGYHTATPTNEGILRYLVPVLTSLTRRGPNIGHTPPFGILRTLACSHRGHAQLQLAAKKVCGLVRVAVALFEEGCHWEWVLMFQKPK